MEIIHQPLREGFEKWKYLYQGEGKKYFHSCKHHITAIDLLPHSHPFTFRSHILQGSYVERIYTLSQTHSNGYFTAEYHRKVGDKPHMVYPGTIHEIIALHDGEVWTEIVPEGPAPVDWHFWNFENGIIYRRLEKGEFEIFKP